MRPDDVEQCDPLTGVCPGCGHDVSPIPGGDLGAALVHAARRWADLLERAVAAPSGDDAVRQRPQPDVWSALEYACHVRDALSFAHHDLHVALADPSMAAAGFDQHAAASAGHYRHQFVDAVSADIVVAAVELARASQRLDGTEEPASMRARWGLHEALHHLVDAAAVLPVTAPQ